MSKSRFAKISSQVVDGQLAALKQSVELMKVLGASMDLGASGDAELAKLAAIAGECGAEWQAVRSYVNNLSFNEKRATRNGVNKQMVAPLEDRFSCVDELPEILVELNRVVDYCKPHARTTLAWIDDGEDTGHLFAEDIEHARLECCTDSLKAQAHGFEMSANAFSLLVRAYAMQVLEGVHKQALEDLRFESGYGV
jgi:hypothetical protein